MGPAGVLALRKVRFPYPVHRWPYFEGALRDDLLTAELLLDSLIWGADVIHAHNTYPGAYAAARVKSLLGIPLVITPHGDDIHMVPELGFGQRLDPLQKRKIAFCLDSADRVTAISAGVEASILDAGVDPGKVRRISNGVDLERFRNPDGADVRGWLRLEPDSRIIMTVGNYHPRKGHEVLARAMPAILAHIPSARLVIVGKEGGALSPLLESLGIQDKVRFTGVISFKPRESDAGAAGGASDETDFLAALYAASNLYVSAATNEGAEGLSLAVLEAMGTGLPIVGSRVSGNRDVIRDGELGFLVPPGDAESLAGAIVRILGDGEMRGLMAVNARREATRYQWPEIARHYLDVYEEALAVAARGGLRRRIPV
jgi:glycosyltransferase involved in cell wall biosynthesis